MTIMYILLFDVTLKFVCTSHNDSEHYVDVNQKLDMKITPFSSYPSSETFPLNDL